MKPLALACVLWCLLSPLGALSVRLDATGAPGAEQVVGKAIRHAVKGMEGPELSVTVKDFSQDEAVTSLVVELQVGDRLIVERPLVATKGWEGKLERLLASQLSHDLSQLYPFPKENLVLEDWYFVRPVGEVSFKPGMSFQSRDASRKTGLLEVRDVYDEVIRLDAVSNHGIRIGQELKPASGQSLEGWVSISPLGGELSYSFSWPYPFRVSIALASLDDRVLCEAGLEKLWRLSSISRNWLLANSSLGAGVRVGVAFPFALGASASVTWRMMLAPSLSFALGGRLLYYGNQEEKRAWQDGYQLVCGVGYHW